MIGSTPEFTGKQPDDRTVDTIRAEDPVNLHGTLSQPHSEPALYPRTANNGNYSDADEEYFAISSERNITDTTTTNNAPDMPELEDSDSEELTMDDFRNRRRSDLENIGIDEVDDDVNVTSGSKGSSEVDGGQTQLKQQQESLEGAAKQPDHSDSKEYKDFTIIDSASSSTTTNTYELKSKSDDTLLKTSESDKTNVLETVTAGTVATGVKVEGQEPSTIKDTKEDSETTTTTTAIDSGTGNDSTSVEVSTTATTSSSLTSTGGTVTSTATTSSSLEESSSVVNLTTGTGTSSTTSVSEASSAANVSTSTTPVPEASSSTNDTPTAVSQTSSGANVNAASATLMAPVSEASSVNNATNNSSTSNIAGPSLSIAMEVRNASTASTRNNANNSNTVNNNNTDTTTTTAPSTTGVTVAEVINGVVVVTEENKNTENVDGSVGDKAKEDEEDEEKMLENSKAWMQEKLLGLIGAIIPSNERSVSAFIVCFWFAIYLFAYMSYSLERSCIF